MKLITQISTNKTHTDQLGTPYLSWCHNCNQCWPNPKDRYQGALCRDCLQKRKQQKLKQKQPIQLTLKLI